MCVADLHAGKGLVEVDDAGFSKVGKLPVSAELHNRSKRTDVAALNGGPVPVPAASGLGRASVPHQ